MKWMNLLNIPLSIFQNAFNAFMQDKQNKHNEKLVDMQNQAAERQADKAYIRSLPSNQMQNMRSAGISDFAAAQAISGGGTYQPAPVNTSQGVAPQIDLNGAMQAITSAAQLKEQKRQFDLQHAEQKRQFDLNYQETKRVNDDALLSSKSQRSLNQVEIDGKTLQNQLLGYEAAVEKELFDSGQTLSTRSAQRLAEHAQAVLDSFKSIQVHKVMLSLSDDELSNLFKLQGYMNFLSSVTTYDVPAKAKEFYNKAKDLIQGIVLPKGAKK